MLIVAHTMAGAASGSLVGSPLAALGIGVLSHHLLDAIPHYDTGTWKTMKFGKNCPSGWTKVEWWGVAIDFFISVILIFTLFQATSNPLLFWGALGAILPDMVDNSPFWKYKIRKFFPFNFYHKFHENFRLMTVERANLIWLGILTQIIILGGSLWILWRFS